MHHQNLKEKHKWERFIKKCWKDDDRNGVGPRKIEKADIMKKMPEIRAGLCFYGGVNMRSFGKDLKIGPDEWNKILNGEYGKRKRNNGKRW